jgi:signal transduction histidine kinase
LGLELLEDDLRDDVRHIENIRDVREACDTAVVILNDLLQYDKLKDNNLQMQLSPHSLVGVVEEAIAPFTVQVTE